jgi:Trk K+ transport system NAD-binding subunit
MSVRNLTEQIARIDRGSNGDLHLLVIGCNHVGSAVAGAMGNSAEVTYVADPPPADTHATGAIDTVVAGDATEKAILAEAGAGEVDVAVIALDTDASALLATQHLRQAFDVETVIAQVNDPELTDLLESHTDAVVTVPTLLAEAFLSTVEQLATTESG